jgi:hypothetical protein
MAQEPGKSTIVTLGSLTPPESSDVHGLEAAGIAPGAPPPPSLDDQLRNERYAQIKERLRQETRVVGPDLMITVPDREVSLLQSELARQAKET